MINADIQMNAQAMLRVSAMHLMGNASQTTTVPTNLYYTTTREKAQQIIQIGLRKGACLTSTKQLASHYSELIADTGHSPVILEIDSLAIDQSHLKPDLNLIDEPITTNIGMSYEGVASAWRNSGQDWRASLEIVCSVCYEAAIPAWAIRLMRTHAHAATIYV